MFYLVYLDKSWTRKGHGSVYDKWNIFVVICDTDIPFRSPIGGCDRKAFEVMTNFPGQTALHTNKEYGMIIFVPKIKEEIIRTTSRHEILKGE